MSRFLSKSIARLGYSSLNLAWAVGGISLRERNSLLSVLEETFERSNISPLIGTQKEFSIKGCGSTWTLLPLMVEHHSLGMALTTPIKRKYWLGVSFALRAFSLPRKILSLETKSPTWLIPRVLWRKAWYKDLPSLKIYLLFQKNWFIIS